LISCSVGLCIYNHDYECTLDVVEIESSGRCYQYMSVLSEEVFKFISKETLELIKKELLNRETELWKRRLLKE
jgi:hypothetical protein